MNKLWIWKKRWEIRKFSSMVEYNLSYLNHRTENNLGRDGTKDLNMMHMYKLRGKGRTKIGTTVNNLHAMMHSLEKAIKTLDRFERLC